MSRVRVKCQGWGRNVKGEGEMSRVRVKCQG